MFCNTCWYKATRTIELTVSFVLVYATASDSALWNNISLRAVSKKLTFCRCNLLVFGKVNCRATCSSLVYFASACFIVSWNLLRLHLVIHKMKLEITYLTPSKAAQVFTNAGKIEKKYDNKCIVWNIIYYIKHGFYHLYNFISLSDKSYVISYYLFCLIQILVARNSTV